MPTNTAGTSARQYQSQTIHYMRRDLTFADDAISYTVGILPAGAVMLKPISGFDVQVAFDGSAVVDIGSSSNDDLYATDLATSSITFVPFDEAVSLKVSVDTTIIANVTGGTITTGAGTVVIAYIPDNDNNG